jgi:radical SAM protein with 4Fe4S-binding SPASM domain
MPLGLSFRMPLRLRFRGGPLTRIDLSWAEGFWRGIQPYVHLRQEDHVLILPPSRVFKLNPTGYQILDYLSQGGRLKDLPLKEGNRLAEVNDFFSILRQVYDGETEAVERVPYDFDFTRLPILGEIALTYRCNHACLFCYAGCGSAGSCTTRENGQAPMTTAEVKRVIDLFKTRAKIPFFSFTGGEPMLREDLAELVRYGRSHGFRINLITNGTLATPERCTDLAEAGLSSVQVSLEAPEDGLHDRLTAVAGSHQRALAGIRAFQAAGIPVQTNTTLTRLNASVASEMPSFLDSISVKRFSMNLFIPSVQGPVTESLFLPYTGLGTLVDDIRRAAFQKGLTFHWYSPTPFCHYNPVARGMGNKNCAAMDGLISVSPTGDVLPCSSYAEPMGNLLTEDFDAIWFSARARHFKQKRYAPAECEGCPSFAACQSACPLYWAYAGTDELQGKNPTQSILHEISPCT